MTVCRCCRRSLLQLSLHPQGRPAGGLRPPSAGTDTPIGATALTNQRYVSKELAHFLGRSLPDDEARYLLLVKVLQEGWLTHPPHNPNISGNVEINTSAVLSNNDMYVPQVVCFCDIPIDDLAIHTRKYGRFGLTFSKATLLAQGANPVFYIASSCQVRDPFHMQRLDRLQSEGGLSIHDAARALVDTRVSLADVYDEGERRWSQLGDQLRQIIMRSRTQPGVPKEFNDLQELTSFLTFHFFSYLKFFDPAKDDEDNENYYMEREWRVVGNVQFRLQDVVRVLLPQRFGARLRNDVPGYTGQVTFLN
jgi:hypothetical protein